MPLPASVRSWLEESVPGPVGPEDLDQTYAFSHPSNAGRTFAKQVIERVAPPPCALWHVEFFDTANNVVLDGPLARKVFATIPLRGNRGAMGAVAYNATLFVRPAFQKKGFTRALYASET